MAVLAVVSDIVGVPLVLAPFQAGGQLRLGILHLAGLGAELLAQHGGAGRADLHALAAGHALVLVHMGTVGGSGEVGGVEVLAGAQGEANAQIAVAETEDLVGTVDVGGLVNVAVLLGALTDLQGLFLGDAAALAGLYQILGKIAQADAAVVLNFAGALAVQTAGVAAGAVANREAALILIQPVGDVLDGERLVLGLDGLLHGDDMHADAVAAGRDQVSFALQRKEGHLVKGIGKLRIFLHLPEDHIGHLGNAGNEELNVPLLFVLGVLPMILYNAVVGGVGEQLLDALLALAGELCDFRGGLGLAQTHFQHDLCDLIAGTCAVQDDVLGVRLGQALDAELVRQAVGDHFAKVKQDLSCHSCSPSK